MGLIMAVTVHFLPDDILVDADPGESLLKVADRGSVNIPRGCLMGSCHACEVEMNGEDVRSCITAIPSDTPKVTVYLFSDPSWG
jgi:aerobic-type carbon monoxide dehydrogenase small subunit (CoxS/CutS family)